MWITGSVLAVGAVSAAATTAWRSTMSANSFNENQLFTVDMSSFDLIIPTGGELKALDSIEIRNKLESRAIIKWIISEGSHVAEGDPLVHFATDSIDDRIQQEELNVSSAENALQSAERALRIQESENNSAEQKADLRVQVAELELARWKEGQVTTKRRELTLAIEKADRNLDRLEREYKDSEQLFERGFISLSEKDQDYIELIEARAAKENADLAQKTYGQYTYPKEEKQKNSDLDESRTELGRTKERNQNQLDQKNADFDARKEQLDIRGRGLQRLREQLEACTITAPASGLVVYGTSTGGRWWRSEESLEIGKESYPNQLLISLPDTSRLIASVKVHESQVSQVVEGMDCKVTVDAKKNISFDGKVSSVGVMAEQNFGSQVREYTVEILLVQENDWDLKPSMRCKGEIFLGRVENVLSIPIESVFVEKGKHYCWIQDGSKFRHQVVEIGRASETLIEIRSGISEGEVVLLREPDVGERQS